ncbi:RICIN domain-containing protein [Kitasatospora sp. NBC_01539]|uniref:RICIN domain-containing protein n=1 Tax=Kitasatospora sp. NBC_01539 TaxID=2903577 RepID=UPI0038600EC9
MSRNTVRMRAAAVVAGTFALLAGGVAPASAEGSILTIRTTIDSHVCLEVGGWATNNGAPVNLWECTGGENQQWDFVTHDGYYQIKNVNSGKCLEVRDWSTVWGAQIDQWDCTGGANQDWQVGAGRYVNRYSRLLLEIHGWSTANGTSVDQWGSNDGANQIWR